MEKFFLCALLARDELHVVHQQEVNAAVAIPKAVILSSRMALMRSLVKASVVTYSI